MPKNPFLNAVFATLYISGVVSIISHFDGQTPNDADPTILMPMAILSLFVLSAAVMGYLFLAEPLQLFLDGKRKEAVAFFFKTVVTFACITIALLGVVFYVSI